MRIINDFISLFFPRYCLACSGFLIAGETILCTDCIVALPWKESIQRDNPLLKQKFTGRLLLHNAFSFFEFTKGGILQHLLHQLKYHNHPEIGVTLGVLCGRELAKRGVAESIDLIIAVPVHSSRMRKRGYNQSEKFAEGLSSEMGVPYESGVIVRNHRTDTQTNKSILKRWSNVKNVFTVVGKEKVKGKHILLVDDVITTGATIESCGSCLIQGECLHLSIACIAEA